MRFVIDHFAKIQHAEIEISGITLLVGDNNTGKTMLMQLIYSVINQLRFELVERLEVIKEEKTWYCGPEQIDAWIDTANGYIRDNIKSIIKGAFHNDIPIEKVVVTLDDFRDEYVIDFENGLDIKEEDQTDAITYMSAVLKKKKFQGAMFDSEYRVSFPKSMLGEGNLELFLKKKIIDGALGSFYRSESLYLPPSRTGIQLLYKKFFAEIAEKNKLGTEDDGEKPRYGLTEPVYDFLQFLIRYESTEGPSEKKRLVSFAEEHLINGRIVERGDLTAYCPSDEKGLEVPLYLSSSMVNELTPLIKVISGRQSFGYLFYDEIEMCLHPEKQFEMARLIIRMANTGMNLIISTHSDSMAAKLNNLLILANTEYSEEKLQSILEKTRLEEDDILKKEIGFRAYQLRNGEQGSECEELLFRTNPIMGFRFDQFNDALDHLYEEQGAILS